tara:strand:+ start:833 stop:1726 length:894 start_codon:yes stop_codon:yes gene_type:complete
MKKIILIGLGSISKKHIFVLKKIKPNIKILKLSSQKFDFFNFEEINKLKIFNPDMIILCSPASKHFSQLKKIEKTFTNKKVLIEKPVFERSYKTPKRLKNKYFIGYNLRFHPILGFIKNYIKKKKLFLIEVTSQSYLPLWRKTNYTKSVSAQKKLGGGVLLELSHELDYLKWIFKNLKVSFKINKKISNLKIDTDDILNLTGKINNSILQLNLNFFSKIPNRSIKIDGLGFSLKGDLIKNKIEIISNTKTITKKFTNFRMIDTYELQMREVISGKIVNTCTLKESLALMRVIQKIKD